MGSTLTGQKIKDTYLGFIKTSDSLEVTASGKELTDGNGNDLNVFINTAGEIGFGSTPDYTIDAGSSTGAFRLPNGSTAQQPTGQTGLIRYNTTDSKLEYYDSSFEFIASENYVNTQINNLIDSSPAALDTLNEIAAALNDDPDFYNTITALINSKQDTITGAATTIISSNLTVSRALISDVSGKVVVSDITSTEIGYLDGVNSNIQVQLNSKVESLSDLSITASSTEINFTDGVTSNIQTQLDDKQATITGAATSIDDTDLTASRALTSDASGKVAVSTVTDTELGYLSGTTSTVQTQIDSKQNTLTAGTGIDITSDTISTNLSNLVNTGAIQNDAVTAIKIEQFDDNLSAATGGDILVSDGTDFTNATVTGDVTISSTGVTTIGSDKIDGTNIADDSIDSEHYVAGSIDEEHLNVTNAPTDDYILSYDQTSGGFTWIAPAEAGGIQWQSSIKTSAFTAGSNKGYFVNTTSASITVTLPATPSVGDLVGVIDYASTADTNKIVITSSKKIQGVAGDKDLNYENAAVEFVFSGDTQGWLITSAGNESDAAITDTPPEIDFLLIAGGGGGGSTTNPYHGGGGAGEYLEKTNTIVKSDTYTVTIGAGGGTNAAGSNSTFASSGGQTGLDVFDYTLFGGGTGNGYYTYTGGGSGVGGQHYTPTGQTGTANESAFGSLVNDGGNAGNQGSVTDGGAGGGGGAGSDGSNYVNDHPGNGGTGAFSSITGTSIERAGGGGGGGYMATNPIGPYTIGTGTGGGGNGGIEFGSSRISSTTGTANTGGGGGGGCNAYTQVRGKAGGSGVCIIKYADTLTITVGAGLTYTEDTTTVSGFKIATFTAGTDTVYWT